MPIYVYQCTKCGVAYEALRKHSDPMPNCNAQPVKEENGLTRFDGPRCDGGPMQKLMTAPAFNFQNGVGTDMGLTMAVPGFPLPPTS